MHDTSTERAAEALCRVEAWLAQQRGQRTLRAHEGLLLEVEERDGATSAYSYDGRGDLLSITEAGGGVASFFYDERRRLSKVLEADGESTSYQYTEDDRLSEILCGGVRQQFEYDAAGRLACATRGDAGAVVYRYDERGRVVEGRTSVVSTEQDFDTSNRVRVIRQTLDGVCLTMRLDYDEAGRLAELTLPGGTTPIRYTWDAKGRPHAVFAGRREIAGFEYDERLKTCLVRYANGVSERTQADAVDARPCWREVARGEQILLSRTNDYEASGQLRGDGVRSYEYDAAGRLTRAASPASVERWDYAYDALGHRAAAHGAEFACDEQGRPVRATRDDGGLVTFGYDRSGRLIYRSAPERETVYRYDAAGQLREVLHDGDVAAQFTYDHKGRLAAAHTARGTERYLYGPADELFAVTDEQGYPLRLFVRTPFGCLAEIRGTVEQGALLFLHQNEQGTCLLVTDERGAVVARPHIDPFGKPVCQSTNATVDKSKAASVDEGFAAPVMFCGRLWNEAVGLYYFGSRWYDPALGCFITPDTYTARPDDARILLAPGEATGQAFRREHLLPDWLKRPATRSLYAFCANDPVNCVDPDGHWSFGRVLLSILGAIWTLPNTLFGLLIEITCLVGEVIRWIVWLVTLGHVSWATPGFDAASSGRLNAFALVFTGGWLGSFSSLLGITFGNVFFVYKDWRTTPSIAAGGNVAPTAYNGTVTFPRTEALYEHELRHTNQYGWFGPFFHLGLPVFGVYEWDVILHGGYGGAHLEADASAHGGI
jgi:RHS repeat-associated protein